MRQRVPIPELFLGNVSGLIYILSAVHSLASSFSVVEVLPEPLGPATTQSTGRSSLILVVL